MSNKTDIKLNEVFNGVWSCRSTLALHDFWGEF